MTDTLINTVSNDKTGLSVGAISANLMQLSTDLALLEQCGVSLLHFDVMDGHFVPQLTIGPSFVKAVKTAMFKDVHLMIEKPFDSISHYAAAGADIITVHAESCVHVRAALQLIGTLKNVNDANRGIMRGIAINPGTSLCTVKPLLQEADIVTLVAINPGYAGQSLYSDTAERIVKLRNLIAETNRKILVCIDGGVTHSNSGHVWGMNPDIVVSGSAIFEKNAIKENVERMQKPA